MEKAEDHPSSVVEDAESAIDKLPLEILAHVFKLGTHFEEIWEDEPVLLPWKVSRVCRLWRSVALSTPDLWRNIVIQDLVRRDVDAVQLQLDRSQQCLLSLRFVGLDAIIPDSYPEVSLERLIDILRQHLHRVRLLDFPEGSWGLILPKARRSLPATSIFPSLREVECTGDLSDADLSSIPSQQLTRMSLISMNHIEILNIIERSRLAVETLIIRDPYPDFSQPVSVPEHGRDPGIVLPRLKSLSIGGADLLLVKPSHSNEDRWIHSAPMLKELTVLDPEDDSSLNLDSITALIQRSSSSSDFPHPLASLTISSNFTSYDATSLKPFFSAVPAVTSLDMHTRDILNALDLQLILQLLARTVDDTCPPVPEFCPFLRSIRFGSDEEDDVFYWTELHLTQLIRMVESRRLEKLEIRNRIKLCQGISAEARDAIEMLRERYEIEFI